ncbi:MAG: aminotransferase class IV [Sphingobacteriales bacterium]|jgi:4-amino-4-deoxychorismate lyase|nr:aminotransferase class IV [Sphingobacteriales bacterium]
MYPLFETICINNGLLMHGKWHEQRFESAYRIYYGKNPAYRLFDEIEIPEVCNRGLFKLRISYNEFSKITEVEKYTIKDIRTLKLVEDNLINYNLKLTDRTQLNHLFSKRGDCDDILIVKNGLVTDSLYCNIVFSDGSGWFTPSAPLLRGTAGARLIAEGRISEKTITADDILSYRYFKLINAMRDFDRIDTVEVENIK